MRKVEDVKKIRVVAITGRSGSGKSTVAKLFSAKGYTVLDADEAAKKAVEKGSECLRELAQFFGKDIILQSGELDKKLLAQRAFETKDKAKILTNTTHPHIVKILNSGIETAQNNGEALIFIDGAVIIGGMFEKYCDEFIVVTAPFENAVERIMSRDSISESLVKKRLASQLPEEDMLAKAKYIIENNTSNEQLCSRAKEVLKQVEKSL